jgi:dihydroorotate dehydrogenase
MKNLEAINDFSKKIFLKIFLKILRIFPPEISSSISLNSIKLIANLNHGFLNVIPKKNNLEKVKISELEFDHYLGLSAGIDKSGDYFHSLGSIGFSFIEVGTFTPKGQKGNEFPRVKRITNNNSLINRLGFNNPGINLAVEKIDKNKKNFSGILGISIGKNKDTLLENAYLDYNFCMNKCFNQADYIAINISSPNTKGLRKLTSPDYIKDLSKEISLTRKNLNKKFNKVVPIFLKLSPDEKDENLQDIVDATLSNGFDGYIVANTTHGEFGGIHGGISGELLKLKSNEMLRKVKNLVGGDAALIASGGISSKRDVEERLNNGASLIQIYTSFVYKGPFVLEELLF